MFYSLSLLGENVMEDGFNTSKHENTNINNIKFHIIDLTIDSSQLNYSMLLLVVTWLMYRIISLQAWKFFHLFVLRCDIFYD